jgi:predicted MPP superfamily phosphohydrolase
MDKFYYEPPADLWKIGPISLRLYPCCCSNLSRNHLATRRTVFIFNLIFSIFFLLNAIAIGGGLSLYPQKWIFIFLAAVLGNTVWLLIPFILKHHSGPKLRLVRAFLNPLWVSWILFIFLYSVFMVITGLVWLITGKGWGTPFETFALAPSNTYLTILSVIYAVGLSQMLFTVKLERVTVLIKNLPAEFAGYKIAMLTDLHVGLFTRLSRLYRHMRLANQNHPDLMVICGDITDDDFHYIPKFLKGLEALDPQIPVVGVLGNHDFYADPQKSLDCLKDSRLRIFLNQGEEIKRGSASLWLAGVSDYAAGRFGEWAFLAPDFNKALAGKPAAMPVVLMCHQPRGFKDSIQHRVDLTLSGHTHGGQLGFKTLNWSLAKLFMKYHMGLFREGESQLYVSTGTGFWALPVRFGLSPEISLIELQPA